MSDVSPDPSGLGPPPHLGTSEPPEGGDKASFVTRYALAQKAGGIVVPILTVFLAFLIGGVVVLITTGSNPISTYRAIFDGAGLNWFTEVGSYEIRVPLTDAHVWFPWNVNDIESTAAFNLQQTLINFVPLVLTGLAVGFAFRCGMFNIGGQGQYLGGAIMAVWIGSELPGLPSVVHVLFAVVAGALMGAVWAGIAGFLKAIVGTHEVISTIMLNWIAIWVGVFLFGLGGPLQNDTQPFVPVSNDVVEGAKLPIFWGDPFLQALHVGFFVALIALVVYWITLNRTTLGYEVRAVGYSPEAARYGGISVARNYFVAMAISGAFAGLAGAILAVWVGSSFEHMNPYLHVGLAILIGTLMGALIAGIAGFLKATVGTHEVIATIMLNWIAIWIGVYLFSLGGPLQNLSLIHISSPRD